MSCYNGLLLIVLVAYEAGLLEGSSMQACRYDEDTKFNSTKKCDGVWDCPIHGGDERGCGKCHKSFQCSKGSSMCYEEKDRCNGSPQCINKTDEAFCTSQKCGPRNGTFLCDNKMCIKESWLCDGSDDCGDNSDEKHCQFTASRKVIIAAVVGALMCGLLLTIAVGCICRLYALQSAQRDGHHHQHSSPMTAIEEEIWRRQSAPPNYDEAMSANHPVEDASGLASRDSSHTNNTPTEANDEDDDVPLLNPGMADGMQDSSDDCLLNAVGATGQSLADTLATSSNHGNTNGNVIVLSGKTDKVVWWRSPSKAAMLERSTSNQCDNLENPIIDSEHEQSNGASPQDDLLCHMADLKDTDTANTGAGTSDICLKCSTDTVQIENCHCMDTIEASTDVAVLLEDSTFDLEPGKHVEDLKSDQIAVI